MESAVPGRNGRKVAIHAQLLGPLTIGRSGVRLKLPSSRKVRALFAYLALAPQALSRGHLCELLWDVPNDPRGELRWCLSKLRSLLDEPDHRRIVAHDDLVALDLSFCRIDVMEIRAASTQEIGALPVERLRELSRLFVGDFLEGLAIDRSPLFESWLIAQRRRFRACHVTMLEHLVKRLPAADDEIFPYLEKWIELAPFDQRAHLALLKALAERGRFGECEEHLAQAARRFEAEELNFTPLYAAWRSVKERLSRPEPLRADHSGFAGLA